jgi:hypothetical protein
MLLERRDFGVGQGLERGWIHLWEQMGRARSSPCMILHKRGRGRFHTMYD